MAVAPTIRLASRCYDGTLPILRRQMQLPGFDLEITETEDVAGMFSGMFKGQYDVSEMSLGELIYYKSRGKADFTAIPVFPSRMFRHGFIFCRTDSDITSPGDLNGKKLGFLRWVQTAAIWMRGMLMDEYGVSPNNSSWYVASMHHWDDHDPGATVEPRDGSVINLIRNTGKTVSERACQALFDGQVDALGVTESQLSTLRAHPAVRKLFEDSRAIEAAYFRKTRILPIMHVLAMRENLAEKHPDLPTQLFHLYSKSKHWARRWRKEMPSLVQAWPSQCLADEQEVFKTDPWVYGIAANRHVLERFLVYCAMQGISARNIAPEELFHPSTLNLVEQSV